MDQKGAWREHGNESEAWKRQWFLRMKDLIDQHEPDLFYTDGAIPFGEWGLSLVAHYYNQAHRWGNGKVDVAYNSKSPADCATGTCVLDIERGVVEEIWPNPWQTDTCVGHWYYHRDYKYKTPKTVVDLLVDIVSRNGNLLLNFPLHPDGSLVAEQREIVGGIAKWMAVNGEAIYGTRPWKIHGQGSATEGATGGRVMHGTRAHFNERQRKSLTAGDVRFTAKGKTIYAFAMGVEAKEAIFRPLGLAAETSPGKIASVRLLGHKGKADWKQGRDALRVEMPSDKPCDHAVAFEVTPA
jgi:alpha-L-fucosidase